MHKLVCTSFRACNNLSFLHLYNVQNATVGSTILQVRAVDSDIGNNGVVRYKFRQEFSRHWEAFNIDSTTGVLTLAQPLDREKQKIYHVCTKDKVVLTFLFLLNHDHQRKHIFFPFPPSKSPGFRLYFRSPLKTPCGVLSCRFRSMSSYVKV